MNTHIAHILEEARHAPSVLNTQPWRFRVCGNTIEVYLDKQEELEEIDPKGRLQVASCGTLIAHLERAVLKRGWTPKLTFFPRFEEPDLLAFIEAVRPVKQHNPDQYSGDSADQHSGNSADQHSGDSADQHSGDSADRLQSGEIRNRKVGTDVLNSVRAKFTELASGKEIGLVMHDDSTDYNIHTYLRNKCGEKLKSEFFRKTLNLYLRTDVSDSAVPFEDEVLLSDRFFDSSPSGSDEDMASAKNVFMILTTGTDNRYEWIRVGQVLGDIIIELRTWNNIGLMALPIISNDCCRGWLKNRLELTGYPQFVLKMQPDKPREHIRKRPLRELLKFRF